MHRLIFLKTVILFCRCEDVHKNRQSVTACFGVRIASEKMKKSNAIKCVDQIRNTYTYSRTQLAGPSKGLCA